MPCRVQGTLGAARTSALLRETQASPTTPPTRPSTNPTSHLTHARVSQKLFSSMCTPWARLKPQSRLSSWARGGQGEQKKLPHALYLLTLRKPGITPSDEDVLQQRCMRTGIKNRQLKSPSPTVNPPPPNFFFPPFPPAECDLPSTLASQGFPLYVMGGRSPRSASDTRIRLHSKGQKETWPTSQQPSDEEQVK